MTEVAIVDAGPLISAADASDASHERVMRILTNRRYQLVISALCVAEAAYIISSQMGPGIESQFLDGLEGFDVVTPEPGEWALMAGVTRRYTDFPLGAADASIVVLARRFDTDIIVTLDRRHFSAVRPLHCRAFRLLPEV